VVEVEEALFKELWVVLAVQVVVALVEMEPRMEPQERQTPEVVQGEVVMMAPELLQMAALG